MLIVSACASGHVGDDDPGVLGAFVAVVEVVPGVLLGACVVAVDEPGDALAGEDTGAVLVDAVVAGEDAFA